MMQRVDIEPRVGGTYRIVERRDGVDAEHQGRYLEVTRPSRLIFTLEDTVGFQNTIVTIEIVPRDNGCELTLTHEGVSPEYKDKVKGGWTKILEESVKIISA